MIDRLRWALFGLLLILLFKSAENVGSEFTIFRY